MKKALLMAVLVILAIFAIFGTANAGMQKMGSFYVGPFALNQANWTTVMDGQLFRAMENIPDGANLEVYAYTDNSGSMAYNEILVEKRTELAARKIMMLRPDIIINSATGMVYQAGSNDVDYRMARVEVFVPDEWLVTNEELAAQLKSDLAGLKDEQARQRQSISELQTLSRETSLAVKDVKKELQAAGNMGQTVGRLSDLHKITLCVVLGVFALLILAYFMIRRGQKKDTTEIVSTIKNSVVEARRIEVEFENEIYIVRAERRSDGFWYSPFRLANGNDIYRAEWDDIKNSIKGAIKSANENFQKQKEKLIANGTIKVKE